ncbi:O-antigen ligase family protein [Rhodanobacter sp. DHG33]|uniref:O-antigen ligase family protein n=1 Tax=Rhodanobacter sp. DHG33 TaxID=2775921 RepID=UPI00177B0FE8|nr:O-antigen ligase family protein [Rhodanobacter sp. DHG33]MBD8898821.1 O-antigen ligase family protein [Rhodanobacter sp. DHG33]
MDHTNHTLPPARDLPSSSQPSAEPTVAPAFFRRRNFWRAVLGAGLVWMMLGLVAMPSGVSYNPGKLYQGILIVLLYLPAWCLALTQRAATWRQLLPLPAFRIFLLLLGWAALSLAWTQARHVGDEFSRLLSVLAFVLAWPLWLGDDEKRGQRLLLVGGLGIALFAAFYCLQYLWQPPADGRIVGEGVIATANYAAAVMGATCIWLAMLPVAGRRVTALRWLAVLVLLAFIALTNTRSVWLALTLCALSAPLWCRARVARWLAGAMLVVVLACCLWPSQELMERGASLRPQLFMQSMHLIAQHPWLGLGQGEPFTLTVAGEGYTHSHNVLTQTTIELGLPGLLLLVALWLMTAWLGWRHRREATGRLVLALWIYASVVLQFDMPQLLDSPRPGWLLVWLPLALALWLELDARRRATGAPRLH